MDVATQNPDARLAAERLARAISSNRTEWGLSEAELEHAYSAKASTIVLGALVASANAMAWGVWP